ncbi:MAG TPA: TRASH domain-containing protein [Thermoplasmatales archaeon]|nr:TRASH domain-containing protein [Thermoplasmatales archaeon]
MISTRIVLKTHRKRYYMACISSCNHHVKRKVYHET